MPEDSKELRASSSDRAWPLYGAALMMAVSLSMAWTAMPFVVTRMGGTNAHVGYAPAVNTFAYLIALLVTGSRFGHLRVRRTTLSAATIALIATAAMGLIVLCAELRAGGGAQTRSMALENSGLRWIWALIVAGGVGGAAMALYWPFLMSWVSGDYEGVRLNRRLGRYNGAWSSGGTIGPLIGGWLFEINVVLPLTVAVVFVLLSLLLLRLGRDGSGREGEGTGTRGRGAEILPLSPALQVSPHSPPSPLVPEATGLPCDMRLLRDCRWASRIALFSVCACFAIVRSQFALVFRGFGYAESQFGVYLTIYALCNFAALVAAGRWALWHYKPALLIVGQAALLVTLLMTIYGRALSTFLASAVLLGIAYGFAYCSHLYYGASASRKRSTRMVIHETVISTGLTAGSLAGGYLAEHVSLYAPYWFAIGVVGLGMIGQMAIHLGSRARVGLAGPTPTANNVETAEP